MKNAISMDDVRRKHKGHWFDASSMRFFRSRVGDIAYTTEDGAKAFFVSSEQFVPSVGPARPRLYSVRVIDMQTGDISTASEFQQFASSKAATKAAIQFANGELVPA